MPISDTWVFVDFPNMMGGNTPELNDPANIERVLHWIREHIQSLQRRVSHVMVFVDLNSYANLGGCAQRYGFTIIHCQKYQNGGEKETVDSVMQRMIYALKDGLAAPSTFVLFSADKDFASLVHALLLSGHTVIVKNRIAGGGVLAKLTKDPPKPPKGPAVFDRSGRTVDTSLPQLYTVELRPVQSPAAPAQGKTRTFDGAIQSLIDTRLPELTSAIARDTPRGKLLGPARGDLKRLILMLLTLREAGTMKNRNVLIFEMGKFRETHGFPARVSPAAISPLIDEATRAGLLQVQNKQVSLNREHPFAQIVLQAFSLT